MGSLWSLVYSGDVDESSLRSEAIAAVLEQYLEGTQGPASYRELARTHRVLPLLFEWTGFVGLRSNGAIVWVEEDTRAVSGDIPERLALIARVRGSELYPELAFLRPQIGRDWLECPACRGSGRANVPAPVADKLLCYCGGLGRLPESIVETYERS